MKSLSILFFMLSLCFSFPAGAGTLSLKVHNASEIQVAQVTSVLERRFDSIKQGLLSFVKAKSRGNTIQLEFTNWSPSRAQIDYLISSTGLFNLIVPGEEKQPLISEVDIKNARTIPHSKQSEIAILLTQAAGQKLYARTSTLTGKVIALSWNGKLLGKLQISEPLGRAFAIPVPANEDPILISAVLRGGRLPTGVQISRLVESQSD